MRRAAILLALCSSITACGGGGAFMPFAPGASQVSPPRFGTQPTSTPTPGAPGVSPAPSSSPTPIAIPTATPPSVPTPTPSPSAAPSATPTAFPLASPVSNAIAVVPTALTFMASGASYAQTFTAAESGYNGAFTESDTCQPGSGTIATISPTSGTGPSTAFTVTPQNAGSCTVTIHDTTGQSTALPVSVSIVQGVIN